MDRTRRIAIHRARLVEKGEGGFFTILIDGRKITALGPDGTVNTDGYDLYDACGKYIMPGFIEMHGHFYGRATSEMKSQHEGYCPLYLAGGITTVRTPGEFEPEETLRWKKEIEAENAVGPRIFSAGSYFDHNPSIVRWIEGSDALDEIKQKYERWSAQNDFFKVYSSTPPEWIKAVADLAHRDGKKVYGHLGMCSAKEAIDAGIDGLEHGIFTMSEFYDAPSPRVMDKDLIQFDPDGAEADAVIQKVVSRNIAITPTSITFMLAGSSYSNWLEEIDGYRFLTPEAQQNHRESRAKMDANTEEIAVQDALIAKQFRFIQRLYQAEARIFCGTDPSYPLIVPGYAIVEEAKNLQRCGMSNEDILRALTIEAAKELGIEHLTGSIEAGKDADLVLLSRNPMEGIEHLASVEAVFQAGRRFSPSELRRAAEGKIR